MSGVVVGYARTSTVDQKAGLEAQLRDLKEAGCTKLFTEQVSSVANGRPQLESALDYVREGDALIVTKIDRLARSVADLVKITERLTKKGVALRILATNMGTVTPTDRLMLNILGAVAEFEREIMLERQREGVAKAKSEGRYLGRVPTARRKTGDVLRLKQQGKSADEVARTLGISRASVFRILKDPEGAKKISDKRRRA